MKELSVIYAAFTILLALIDAIRIKIAWGKKANIDHDLSMILAIMAAISSIFTYLCLYPKYLNYDSIKVALVFNSFGWPICALIRLALYSPVLNFFRILTKTNPTGRIDYVSATTNSAVDNIKWWGRLSFWKQRAIAVAGWALLIVCFYKITQ